MELAALLSINTMHSNTSVKNGWQNFMNTQQQADAIVIDVNNTQALQTLMQFFHSANQQKLPDERIIIRAAAGGHHSQYSASFSATSVANADIIIRLTGNEFKKVTRHDHSNLIRTGTSIQIGELDKFLYENFELSLPSSSLIPYVTAGGLAAAGGHGTGKNQPSFAGLLRGMTLCLETGEIVHIDKTHPDFETIIGAHNGLFGIVLDMDIECIPAKKLQCVMEKRSVPEFFEEVEKGLFESDPYVSVMYVPSYLPDELTNTAVNNVIIYRWRPVPLDTKDSHHKPCLDNLEQAVLNNLDEAINLPEILRTYPKLIPIYQRHLTAPITIGSKDSLSLGPWHEMMHYRTAYPNDLDEICGIFPVNTQPVNAPQGQEIVKAMKHAITLLNEHAKRSEYPVSYAFYLRYLQGTNGGLSFTGDNTDSPNKRKVIAMDIITNKNIKGFAEFEKNMRDFFLNEVDAKFHWGKNAPFDLDYEKLYGPRWQETKDTLEKWHRDHGIETTKSMLLNPLFSQVFKYPLPSLVDTDTPPCVTADRKMKKQIAIHAGKLLDVIDDKSDTCRHIRTEIEKDIDKNSAYKGCLFWKKQKPQQAETEADKKSECTIL
jgi:hypothetical protein